jgi:hypothetical protein
MHDTRCMRFKSFLSCILDLVSCIQHLESMTCNDENTKDLLPAYREQGLDPREMDRVRIHLEACEDCRADLDLLGLLAEESVPDPGEAFWLAMPERVHRAVQEEKEKKRLFGMSLILDRFILPRWTWTAAAAGVVLLVSWVAFRAPLKPAERPLSPGYDVSEDIMPGYQSPPEPVQIQISEFDRDELETAAAWAGNELASISREVEQGMVNGADTDLYEELRQLNTGEVERLSTMIDRWKQEG